MIHELWRKTKRILRYKQQLRRIEATKAHYKREELKQRIERQRRKTVAEKGTTASFYKAEQATAAVPDYLSKE